MLIVLTVSLKFLLCPIVENFALFTTLRSIDLFALTSVDNILLNVCQQPFGSSLRYNNLLPQLSNLSNSQAHSTSIYIFLDEPRDLLMAFCWEVIGRLVMRYWRLSLKSNHLFCITLLHNTIISNSS